MVRFGRYMMAIATITLLAPSVWADVTLMDPTDSQARQHPHGFSRAQAVDGEQAAPARFDLPGGSRPVQGNGHTVSEQKRSGSLVHEGALPQR